MRARTVNENYPLGAANDPNAPWNEPEDDSQYELEMDGDELVITRDYNFSGPEEWDTDKGRIDPEEFDTFAARKLDIDHEEKWENDDYLEVQGIADAPGPGQKFLFQTNWGEFEASMDELIDLTNLF